MPRKAGAKKEGDEKKERAPKHANGEGGIRQRSDGRWEGRLWLPDGTRKSVYGKTRAEVSAAMTTATENRNKGLPVAFDERQTVARFLEKWLAAIKVNIRPKTWVSYEGYCRLHVIPTLGKVRLTKLTAPQLQTLYSKKQETLSSTTVFHIHATMHRALEQAVKWGDVPRNVAELTDRPRRAHHEMKVLTPEEARAFLEAARGGRLEALYVLAISTGMRQGELLGLRWADVDLEERELRVTATMQRTKQEGLGFREPKTKGSRRQIALTSMAVAALRHHKAAQAVERLRAGADWLDIDLVFSNRVGRPIEQTNLLERSFKPLLASAGLPPIRFHDLRHTYATICLSKKVPAKVVSEMLGHSRIAVTLDTYSHVLPDMQREATAAMEAVLMG